MHMDPQTATAFIAGIVVIFTAGFAGYMHLLPQLQKAIQATQAMLHDVGALKTQQAVQAAQIENHQTALNGGMTERIQGVVAHQLLLAGVVTPPPPAPAVDDSGMGRIAQLRAARAGGPPVPGPLQTRIQEVEAQLAAAREAAQTPAPDQAPPEPV